MPSGFSIIIAAETFDPEGFLLATPIPELPWEVVGPSSSHPSRSPALELYDILTGTFTLDLATELNYFLADFCEELQRALGAPGVTCRNLHLYDESSSGFTEFSFSNAQLRTVLEFGWDVSFTASDGDTKPLTVGARILHR